MNGVYDGLSLLSLDTPTQDSSFGGPFASPLTRVQANQGHHGTTKQRRPRATITPGPYEVDFKRITR
eukprot:gene4003-4357_t